MQWNEKHCTPRVNSNNSFILIISYHNKSLVRHFLGLWQRFDKAPYYLWSSPSSWRHTWRSWRAGGASCIGRESSLLLCAVGIDSLSWEREAVADVTGTASGTRPRINSEIHGHGTNLKQCKIGDVDGFLKCSLVLLFLIVKILIFQHGTDILINQLSIESHRFQ